MPSIRFHIPTFRGIRLIIKLGDCCVVIMMYVQYSDIHVAFVNQRIPWRHSMYFL
jgi:hypothetical protein